MSQLLYLHAVDWPSYENVFVRPKEPTIDAFVAYARGPLEISSRSS